jgi:diguanylate cyclase (GGDEF)-like protein/PAS domain S-box-containing protein
VADEGAARARDYPNDPHYSALLLAAAHDGIAVIDPDGTIVASTPSLDRMLEHEAGALVGVDGLSLIHPDDLDHVALRLAEYVGGGNDGPDVRTRLRRSDGTYVDVELVAGDAEPINHDVGGIVLTVRDFTQRREAEEALRDTRILNEAVASISARFVDADAGSIDRCIDDALAVLGKAAAVDRVYVFSVTADLTRMTNTHEWHASGIESQIEQRQNLKLTAIPRWRDTLARGHSIHIRRVADLDDDWELERTELERAGINSVVTVPLMENGHLRGFIGVESVGRDRTWDDDTIRMLRTVAGILGSLLARCSAQRAALVHEARYRALVQHSSDTIVLLDRDGRVMFSAGRAEPLDFSASRVTGLPALDFVHPEDHAIAGEALSKMLDGAAHAGPFEMRLKDTHGEWVPVEVEASNLLDNPAVGGIVVSFRDIRERLRAEGELRESEARLRTLVKNIPGAVYRCEATPPYADEFVSDAVFGLTGYTAEQFLSDEVLYDELILPGHRERTDAELEDALSTRTAFSIEYPIRHRDGSVRWVLEQGQPTYDADGTPLWLDGVMFDVTERKHLEDRLAYEAAHDPLTGMPNRTLLMETLDRALRRANRTHTYVAVLFLDLDHFKRINDQHGHAVGDDLLVESAKRLQSVLRASDLAARTGGDEFVVVCADMESPVDAEQLAHRIALTLGAPFDVQGREVSVSASIGIAIAEDGCTSDELLSRADTAAYRAKERGRNCYELFDDELRVATATALETETALHRALADEQLLLRYQPIVDLADGRTLGLEGLVRWQHPTRGLIGPEQFLATAEASALIVPIGTRVVEMACATLATLDPGLTLSVNLSPRELAQPDVVERICHTLGVAGADPTRLCLEITEGALLEDADRAIAALGRLKDAGVLLAIDDFGTGYSALSYLLRLPVDIVKIDRSFVDALGRGGRGDIIAGRIIELILGLGLEVVAEGIERVEQATALRALGCSRGQGFLYSPAVELDVALGTRSDATTEMPSMTTIAISDA